MWVYFDTEIVQGEKCCYCGRPLDEGYVLHPSNDEEAEALVKKFGESEGYIWFVGECCFGGDCGVKGVRTPHDWYNEYVKGDK